jgi:hypothetical protein
MWADRDGRRSNYGWETSVFVDRSSRANGVTITGTGPSIRAKMDSRSKEWVQDLNVA